MNAAATLGITLWIEIEEDSNRFAPVGAIARCVEQSAFGWTVVRQEMSVSLVPSVAHDRITYLLTISGGR